MMKITVIALTIGSTTNCLTRTSVPTSTAFIAALSTVPIIVPCGTFMMRLTDINQPRNTTIGQNRCAVLPPGNVAATLSSCIFSEIRLRHHGGLLAAAVPYRKGASHDCSSTTNDGGYAATEFVASYPGILCPTGFAVRTPLR